MKKSRKPLKVLRLLLSMGATSAPYNQFSLAWSDKHDVTISTLFEAVVSPPEEITLFEGDGSITGFIRGLKAALDAGEYDIIHAHSPHVGFLFLVHAFLTRRKFSASTVATVHDSYPNFKLRNRMLLIPVFAGFDRVVCCSRASYESFPAIYKWIAGDRLRVVQNGLDIARVDRTAAHVPKRSVPSSDFKVVAISRLVAIKNPFSLLAAFQQSANVSGVDSRLVYIGDGPLRSSLISESKNSGSENRIEFTGLIPRERVFEHLLGADLFISMSRGEGLPVSVLEAMACRCPVVLSDIPPHREIAEGVDFIPLVQPGDIGGFAREIRRFKEMPASERSALGRKCRMLVEERFSLAAMRLGYEEIYAEMMDRRVSSLAAMIK